MHMADALLSPQVALTAWAASTGLISYSSYKLKKELDTPKKIPLMGVMGAFIFAAQMINFSIPGTGSSGHLGGGLLLAVLLGPWGGFLAITSVLIIQALFFADGGLLALGANIFNLGFFPCLITFPFIYRKIKDANPYSFRSILASGLSVITALQLGSLAVVIQTSLSGITELNFFRFLLVMQPIHLAVGIVEAAVTIGIIGFIHSIRPDILEEKNGTADKKLSLLQVFLVFALLTLITGGFLSWFASQNPDGLEWSISKTAGKEEIEGSSNPIFSFMQGIQEKLSFLPDYNFVSPEQSGIQKSENGSAESPKKGTSFSGIIGALVTFALVAMVGLILKLTRKSASPPDK